MSQYMLVYCDKYSVTLTVNNLTAWILEELAKKSFSLTELIHALPSEYSNTNGEQLIKEHVDILSHHKLITIEHH